MTHQPTPMGIILQGQELKFKTSVKILALEILLHTNQFLQLGYKTLPKKH